MVWNKAEDDGGLSPAKDDNAVFTPELVSFYSPIALGQFCYIESAKAAAAQGLWQAR